jgi:uncharacterized protein (DUF1499 family)
MMMEQIATGGRWGPRWAKAAFWGGIGGAILAVIGAYGSGFGLWTFEIGFLMIAVALVAALIAIIGGMIALFLNRRRPGLSRHSLTGMLAALGFISVIGYWINKGTKVPLIHDITTNLDSPPAFQTLKLRGDNLVGLKGGMSEWRALHARAYADIKPVSMTKSAAEAVGIAKRLVEARGWAIASVGADRIEATATGSPFKFKDDVVIVATPEADGATTRVDMRSVSRVGIGDLGVNAERIRAFLADLKAADGRTP